MPIEPIAPPIAGAAKIASGMATPRVTALPTAILDALSRMPATQFVLRAEWAVIDRRWPWRLVR